MREKQIEEQAIEEMAKMMVDSDNKGVADALSLFFVRLAEALYNAGYRKQNDEELIDKIATYFEEEENWERLMRGTWNVCGNSVQLRDMLRDAICGAKMKGGAE